MNIILQHWDGAMPEWAQLATKTMKRYAEKIGADYELVTGYPLGKEIGPNSQKMVYLLEKYDKYDQTLMLDMDTIATNVCANVFDRPEIGVLHDRAMKGSSRTPGAAPELYKLGEYVFFGNFIKLNKDQRVAMREHADWDWLATKVVDHYSGDEVVLSYLMYKSNILKGKSIEDVCMRCSGTSYEDIYFRKHSRWDRKFANQPEDSDPDASIIHFCRGRKAQLPSAVKRYWSNI